MQDVENQEVGQDVENQEVGADDGFNPNEWNDAEAWLRGATFAAGDFNRDDNIQHDYGVNVIDVGDDEKQHI